MSVAFDTAIEELARTFPGPKVLEVPGRQLIRFARLELESDQWTPADVRGLLICDGWPDERPRLLVGDEVRRSGQEPTGFAREYEADESWFSYSYNFPWDPSRPNLARAVDAWLQRFDGRP